MSYSQIGHGFAKLRARGATDEDLTDLVIQVDDVGNPLSQIGGLRESVLETDST